MFTRLLLLVTLIFPLFSSAAVILQYHHVSDTTPASTSISPAQFAAHLEYLHDNGFKVVPLNKVIEAIKSQTPMTEKWVAITFDDAFEDILTNGTPLLEKYNYPYTLFVNPGAVSNKGHMSWEQIIALSKKNVMIANHGFSHDSIARAPDGKTKQQWLDEQSDSLLETERLIKERTGQNWRYFAYPYGEYTPEIQQWLLDHDFVGFSQQSGAVGIGSDLSIIPRFPASKPYDQLSSLRDKLHSLPLTISLDEQHAQTILKHGQLQSVTFNIEVDDFSRQQLNCYVSGLGRQKVQWLNDQQFTINFSKPLPTGRVRCNCTAPSISERGRFYWYSKPWFILKESGQWYPL